MPPRRRLQQVAGFQVLQVVVGDGCNGNDRRAAEEGERQQELAVGRVGEEAARFADQEQHQRDDDDGDDADTRNRAGGGTDQPCHITAGGGDEEADDDGEQHADDDQQPGDTAGDRCRINEVVEAEAEQHHHAEGDEDHRLRRQILLDARGRDGGVAAQGAERLLHPFNGWFQQGNQRPDGGNTDGACADETHFVFPQAHGKGCHIHTVRHRRSRGKPRHRAAPGKGNADEDGDTAGQADQIAGAEQRQ